MFPDVATTPVIAGLDHEGFPRGETDPAHHPPPPLTEEPLGALVVIVEEHGHPVMDKPSHQGNSSILAKFLLSYLSYLYLSQLSKYRREDSVESLILTSPSQWRDESRRQTQTPHTKLEQIL